MYKPNEIKELRTAAQLLKPTYKTFEGKKKKIIPETGKQIFINFKSRGGSEVDVNGVLSVLDTANVVTWWDPDITSDALIKLENDALYEIMGEPENVELQNQFVTFKVQRYKGGV